MVSKLEMLGERLRALVGVEGTDDDENDREWWSGSSEGNASLNLDGAKSGELCEADEDAALAPGKEEFDI